MLSRLVAALLGVVPLLIAAAAFACGKERWSVKTGNDLDVGQVELTPIVDSTIAELGYLDASADPNAKPYNRWPGETTVYRVAATLTLIKHEADGDYHMVLSDGKGHTMIAEAPDPACAKGSAFEAQINQVRRAIDEYAVGRSVTDRGILITVTGVAFFDMLHGQTGHAPNGIELHPLLSIEFK